MAEDTPAQTHTDRRKNETRLWLGILDVHSFIYPELNKRLKELTAISVSKFDVLAQLNRYPEGLSMGDLSARLKVSNGNVSGLVNRLRKDGLVDKTMSTDDRRSFVAVLTPAGQQRFAEAARVHTEVLGKCLSHLDTQTLEDTTAMLKSIVNMPDNKVPSQDE
ncbi:transcriptional regulator, MarR family [Celeribacter baekdonensis]|uniref:Transcriptional regulator, MarR family n=1 Tax=Celeribacter baekdonensis TaxID=875171 RepID=A0A1G7SI27_9RHOB|nr:MarR family transcriptional regulator [Celeribacter baekdonensis]SDG22621.1 transcriptional regulator, MarR family [Celeribacter baekdonensis]